jgi:type I restriction-modification system DNA methylase subunit
MEQTPSVFTGSIYELSSLFKTCLDILRNDAEHLIGDEALNELSYFLILKQSEKHIVSGAIDILNLDLYKDGISFKSYGKEKFQERLELVKFSKLVEYVENPEKEKNIKKLFDDFLWKEVLSKHPKFKDIFEDGKRSFIKESSTIKNIVLALSSIDFNNYEYDILGEAYEKIFVDAIFGAGGNKKSELGQFFTPPKVKKLLLKLVDPKLKANGEIESVLDPASGTGGILNTTIKHFKQFVKSGKITDKKLRTQLVKNIYGIEIKGKIFNLCLSNMLINTGEILPNVICADSIRKFHNIKVDNIVANPPFSVTIKYDELFETLGGKEILDDYIPIKTGGKNSEMLFLQMMIHCLNINGRCACVMLDGQKMYGSGSGYDKVREYLMRSCDLQKVILCPGGTFTTTASKTCILFFTKKQERKDVLKIEGTKRKLTFEGEHSTSKVEFYDYNPDTGDADHFITEVTIDKIAARNYSLNYSEYNIEEKKTKEVEGIEWKELGEVCSIIKGEKKKSKDGKEVGLYPLYYCSILGHLYLDTFDYSSDGIIINKTNGSGKAMVYYGNNKYNVGESTLHFKSNNDEIKTKYVYYYLFHNIALIQQYFKGANQKSIVEDDLFKIKIPIPSLEKQNKIVEVLDNLFTEKYNLHSVAKYYENYDLFGLLLDEKYYIFQKLVEWQDQSRELAKQIEFVKTRQANYIFLVGNSENTIKTLGELFKLNGNGKTNSKDITNTGEYPFYKASCNNPSGTHNTFDFDGNEYLLIVKSGGSSSKPISDNYGIGKVFNVYGKCAANIAVFQLLPKTNDNFTYLYCYLKSIQNKIQELAKYSTNNGNIDMKELMELKIPVPSLEKQKEIVAYCDYNTNLIKQLENEIENNKELAEQFIKGIVKNVGVDVDVDVDELEVEEE